MLASPHHAVSGTNAKGCTMSHAPCDHLALRGRLSKPIERCRRRPLDGGGGRRVLVALLTGALGLAASWPAAAQVPAPLVGNWQGTWQTENRQYEARLTVTSSGGSWQTATTSRTNPCAGKDVPMKVESATETEVKFLLQFSEVIPGCQNVAVTMMVGPDGAVTGTRSKYELQLVRR